MMRLRRPHPSAQSVVRPCQTGFTTIEMLLLIVVIGILAALVISSRAGVQQNQRNTERERDIKELRDGLEGYFANINQYPTLVQLNDVNWRAANLKALDDDIYRDPSGSSDKLADKPAVHVYAYVPTSSSGTACGTATAPCTQYTLTATLEGGGSYTKSNLN